MPELTDRQKARKYKKSLEELTAHVGLEIARIDLAMRDPDSRERGMSMGKIATALEIANDGAMRFGLNYGWAKIKRRKKGLEQYARTHR